MNDITEIAVTVDKGHITVIGERLYAESIEFIRELVNNAYDADAENVHIKIDSDSIRISDDGTGMDLAALKQYFNIGSQFKKSKKKTSRFKRVYIGEFGIGKFAALSICRTYELETTHSGKKIKVVFDKDEWHKDASSWSLPAVISDAAEGEKTGTAIRLKGLTRTFTADDLREKVIEATPLHEPDFKVYVNGIRVTCKEIPGKVFNYLEGTPSGTVSAEIIFAPLNVINEIKPGLEIRVKGVTVKRDHLGMESWGDIARRITGRIFADFLILTSDRTEFIKDTREYEDFMTAAENIKTRLR